MRLKVLKTLALTTIAALLLSACGGGGGGGSSGVAPADSGDAGAVSYGTITAFGSVWVNGIEFHTGSSSFRIDDNPGLESDLRIGMVVRVDGSIAGQSASQITVDDAIKGRVEQVLDANRMLVMGQTVQVDSQTRFDNGVVPVVGDFVEVHGLAVSDGLVSAGYIERKSTLPTPAFAVKGFVRSHDTSAQTFAVGALSVSYAGAVVNDMPGGTWNGQMVEVKGSTCAGNPVCGMLTATKVEPGGLRVASAPRAEVEGYVTSLGANGFVVGNQPVVVTSSTLFSGGMATDIAVGTKLEAEGSISAGVLTARRVSLRDNVRLEADVASVDATAGSLALAGLPGVTVSVNSLTAFKGGISSLAGLAAPNHLRIRGRLAAGNTVVATELERRSTSSDSRVILQGPVSAIVGTSSVTVLGTVVGTGSVSDNEFKNLDDSPMGRAAFYAALKIGTLVKARADLNGASLTWNQIELED
jgi:hypothetical protein